MKRCPDYVGVACVDGSCPLAIYEDNPDYFDSKPRCKDCGDYKGCSDCALYANDGNAQSVERQQMFHVKHFENKNKLLSHRHIGENGETNERNHDYRENQRTYKHSTERLIRGH